MPETTRDYLNRYRQYLWQVPAEGQSNVCRLCLGAVSGTYDQCFNCNELLRRGSAPRSLQGRVVPMSIVRNPGTWYTILQSYKKGAWREYAPVIASVAYEWLNAHTTQIENLLGGSIDLLTVVPSKTLGLMYETQLLRLALSLVRPIADQMVPTLECVDRDAYGRTKYAPEMFAFLPAATGKRIVLIEDTWITGATAVSAAGALLAGGAESVVITPIARDFRVQFHGDDHPYLALSDIDYDVSVWPRA